VPSRTSRTPEASKVGWRLLSVIESATWRAVPAPRWHYLFMGGARTHQAVPGTIDDGSLTSLVRSRPCRAG
jgi:hypothetical protein